MNRKSTLVAVFFAVAGLLVAYSLHRAIEGIFVAAAIDNQAILGDRFRLSTLLGLLLGAGAAAGTWAWPKSKTYVTEVFEELDKVNWPSFAETRVNTVVVIATSVIAAGMLGVFDITFNEASKLLIKMTESSPF